MLVQNGEEQSIIFATTNGVRQGGIMSPKLYNIYSGQMIKSIREMQIGVTVGNLNIGILMYADDLTSVADCASNLQLQLNKAGEQGNEDDIVFNAKKSVILVFNQQFNKSEDLNFMLNNTSIKIENETRYLGYQLSSETTNKRHLSTRIKKSISSISKLRSLDLIGDNLKPHLRAFLFKVYIRPVILYGIDCCDLNEKEFLELKKAESISLKSLVGINKECQTQAYSPHSMLNP